MIRAFFNSIFKGSSVTGNSRTRKAEAVAMVDAEAAMAMEVHRFQGKYECGCEVDREVLQPEFCVNHPDAAMVFAVENHGIQFAKRTRVPQTIFEGR